MLSANHSVKELQIKVFTLAPNRDICTYGIISSDLISSLIVQNILMLRVMSFKNLSCTEYFVNNIPLRVF